LLPLVFAFAPKWRRMMSEGTNAQATRIAPMLPDHHLRNAYVVERFVRKGRQSRKAIVSAITHTTLNGVSPSPNGSAGREADRPVGYCHANAANPDPW
jgi:hypothetical protein